MIRPMSNESTLTLHAYLDGERDPINAIAVEKRITTDIALAAEFERVESLQRLMREHLPREIPPAGLRMRIETAVGARPAVQRGMAVAHGDTEDPASLSDEERSARMKVARTRQPSAG